LSATAQSSASEARQSDTMRRTRMRSRCSRCWRAVEGGDSKWMRSASSTFSNWSNSSVPRRLASSASKISPTCHMGNMLAWASAVLLA